jgi:hypothetical protein
MNDPKNSSADRTREAYIEENHLRQKITGNRSGNTSDLKEGIALFPNFVEHYFDDSYVYYSDKYAWGVYTSEIEMTSIEGTLYVFE